MGSYQVKLSVYEGPLDLLLHLIEGNQLNIYDIPVAQVTEQYIQYLQTMEEMDLDITSEFLVMAATLLSIKARMLLPRRGPEETGGEGEEALDPRQELVEHLLAYKRYKEAAQELAVMAEEHDGYFRRPSGPVSAVSRPVSVEQVGVWDLMACCRQALARLKEEDASPDITGCPLQQIDLDQAVALLEAHLAGHGQFLFQDLVLTLTSRREIIAVFWGLLDLIRLGRIWAGQDEPFGPILVRGREEEREGQRRWRIQ
jgi:segregation and condensation protein A